MEMDDKAELDKDVLAACFAQGIMVRVLFQCFLRFYAWQMPRKRHHLDIFDYLGGDMLCPWIEASANSLFPVH